jgi:DNA polymerase III subunit epsilon
VAESAEIGSIYSRNPAATAKEKLYAFLDSRPAGADASELVGLLLSGAGSDPELGARIVRGMLAGDPNFVFDSDTALWSLRKSDALRVPLDEARFCVVDLETTGGRAGPGTIIDIGAYRMVGQRITDSFQSLVRPHSRVPRFITSLTSITNEMLADAPPIEEVLPAFREFIGDAVMVAHNAQFDRSFLDYEFRRIFGIGLGNPVLCTLRMARRYLPSLKRRRLDYIADHFGLSTAGRHRGLGDARMAAEILSIFLDIATKMGTTRLDRLIDEHQRGPAGRRIERHVPPEEIAALPHAPGVYLMRNERGDLLYVGKARRLRERVSSYFNGGGAINAKTADLVSHVYKIDTRVTRSALDAALLEARLIRELKPPYNRMLKAIVPAYFVRIDMMDEFPRITIAGKMNARRGVMHLGPFVGRRGVDHSVRALSRILGLRTCAGKLAPAPEFSPCIYGQMGHCCAPCNLSVGADAYDERVRRAAAYLRGRIGPLLGELARARDQAAAALRYEEAARWRRDLEALTALANRASRLSQVVTENNLVIIIGVAAARSQCSQADASDTTSGAAAAQSAHAGEAAGVAANERAAEPPIAHVVLSGRLALSRELDSPAAAAEVTAFIAANFERYRERAVERGELEAMTIVARWLRERYADEGRLIYLTSPHLDPAALMQIPG